MSDRAALYAAICAHPDEDTPRLAYADFLDELGGKENAARARFIREQVEADRLEGDGSTADTVARYLEREADRAVSDLDWSAADPGIPWRTELSARARGGKGRPTSRSDGLPRLSGVRFRWTRRGLMNDVEVRDGATLLRHADAIFRAAPVDTVAFGALSPEEAKDLVAAGHLRRLRALELPGEMDPTTVRVLGRSPDAAGVRSLECYAPLDPVGLIEALAAGRHWTGLRRLDLGGLWEDDERVTGRLFRDLFRNPAFRRLTWLDLSDCTLGNPAARAIAAAGLTELRFLDLALNPIGDAGAEALAASRSLGNLRYLNLELNDFGSGTTAARLIASPRLAGLTVLNLSGNDCRDLDAAALAGKCRPPGLRVLVLDGNRVTAEGLAALGACPAARGLWLLSLSGCGLTAPAVRGFVATADWRELVWLDVPGNRLAARAAEALAGWPGLASVQGIRIRENPLTPAGARALAESPHLGKLSYLCVNKKDVGGSAGARQLAARFGKAMDWY
jgi:uncharacterized protein (TIGR02996 family)